MYMKVALEIEKVEEIETTRIKVVDVSIHLPDNAVKALIQKLHIHKISQAVFSVTDYEIEEKEVKIEVAFMSNDGILDYPKGVIPKDFLDSAFEQIRKLLQLSSELDLYPTLKGAALVIGSGKKELHLNKKILTELITKNS